MSEDNGIEWTSNLSVNDENLDTQHKEIFKIINQLGEAKTDNSKSSSFAQILTILTEYGISHLKEEEKYMSENEFPELEEHKKVHKSYLYKVAMFNLNYNKTSHSEVVSFLKNWWVNHIAKMDIQYRDFINAKKDNGSTPPFSPVE